MIFIDYPQECSSVIFVKNFVFSAVKNTNHKGAQRTQSATTNGVEKDLYGYRIKIVED